MRIRTGARAAGRMTTQMLSKRKRKTGMSSSKNSILGSRLGNSRLSALNAQNSLSTRLERIGYEKLQKSSSSLVQEAKLLGEKVDTGVGDIGAAAESMVKNYNETMQYLRESSGMLNDFYRQSLKETVLSNSIELADIGFKVGNDGSLSLNKEKLAAADPEKVKRLLGGSGDLVKRIDAIASRAADNAKVNAENASSRYNASGGLSGSYFSRYNFRG